MHHQTQKPRLLFVLKNRPPGTYGTWSYSDNGGHLSSGLNNSVRFIVDMLNADGVEAKMVHVIDNNFIDREVKAYRPTHVIIEAYWVVPEKFDVLKKLHPSVTWIVRDHSKSEFLSNEGIAFGWTLDYLARGVEIAANSPQAVTDMRNLAIAAGYPRELVTYLPNYYPLDWTARNEAYTRNAFGLPNWDLGAIPALLEKLFSSDRAVDYQPNRAVINIGCFGAIRPLKNTMNQALAAIHFAHKHDFLLRFHINGNRVEGNGQPIKKNLHEVFDRLAPAGFELVAHSWLDHDKFLVLAAQMDIMSQVAFSETFNIVGADAVAVDVPVIGSNEIPWLPTAQCANPNDVDDIVEKYEYALDLDTDMQWECLHHYSTLTEEIWTERFNPVDLCD